MSEESLRILTHFVRVAISSCECRVFFEESQDKGMMMREQQHVSPLVIIFSIPIRMPGALVDDEPRVGGARGVSNYRGNT